MDRQEKEKKSVNINIEDIQGLLLNNMCALCFKALDEMSLCINCIPKVLNE